MLDSEVNDQIKQGQDLMGLKTDVENLEKQIRIFWNKFLFADLCFYWSN
jgi:hypothetical protein